MPIKRENKDKYPKNWKQISEYIRFVRANNKCEICGIENYSIIEREYKGKIKKIKVILTVAHLDHNPENNDINNLRAMCQKCHNTYDREHRNETIKRSKNWD